MEGTVTASKFPLPVIVISMAMGSCSEVETWISYAFDLGYISQAQHDDWLRSYAHIYGMLINLREKLK